MRSRYGFLRDLAAWLVRSSIARRDARQSLRVSLSISS